LSWQLLTNDWFNWVFSTYSVLLGLIPTVIGFILKLLAVFHPDIPSDKIIDLIKSYKNGKVK